MTDSTDIWTATVRITPDVLHQELGGETVLLNLASESYFGLDEVGTFVWQVLEKQGRADAALSAVLTQFDVKAEQARADIERLITELVAAGLVTIEAHA